MNNLDTLFKAYDIRGVYPDELNEEFARDLGRAFATFVEADTVMVGYDMRTSSVPLSHAFAEGVTATGKNAIILGLIATDMAYFAAGKYNLPVAMFTASHNPSNYNGVKLTNAGAAPIGVESGLRDIRKILETRTFLTALTNGVITEKNILDDYTAHVLNLINPAALKPYKIAIDAGNGMAGMIVPKIFEHLPCTIVPLYFELDGTMPNHEPNPIDPKNVQELIAVVKREGCDLGLAFDGDADRVFFIDEHGNRISSSLIVAAIAKNILQEHPGATIIYNLVCSNIVPETIVQYGGIAVREHVGHSYIKATMKKTGALFAGEHSGHYYFLKNYRADSGMIAALMVLELLSQSGKTLSQLLHEFQKYYSIEETNSNVADKHAVIQRLKERYYDAKTIDDFDGLTFTYDNFWFNVRASNTEPALRLNLEAETSILRDQKTEEILSLIRASL